MWVLGPPKPKRGGFVFAATTIVDPLWDPCNPLGPPKPPSKGVIRPFLRFITIKHPIGPLDSLWSPLLPPLAPLAPLKGGRKTIFEVVQEKENLHLVLSNPFGAISVPLGPLMRSDETIYLRFTMTQKSDEKHGFPEICGDRASTEMQTKVSSR